MSDFKKNNGLQNNNKPQGFKEPHGTPIAPEGEKQQKDMSNGGKNEQNMGNKRNGKCSNGTCKTNGNKCDNKCCNDNSCK